MKNCAVSKLSLGISIYLPLIGLAITACATTAPGQSYRLSNNGYATVLSAPHSKLSKQDIDNIKDSPASSSFIPPLEYSQLREEALQLKATLAEQEPDNFTEFRYVWDPEFYHLFSFKRDPEKTLAKYTTNPHFKAGTQRHFKPYLEAKHNEIVNVLASANAHRSSQINMLKGVVEVSTGAYKEDFMQIPGIEKYRNDPDIAFDFLQRRSPEKVIDPRVAPHIRMFLRDNNASEHTVVGSSTVTIQLRDGCFFHKEQNALILFPESSNLGLDEDGRIIIHNERGDSARVGEKSRFNNGIRLIEETRYTEPLQEVCGDYPVVKINDPRSEYVAKKTVR